MAVTPGVRAGSALLYQHLAALRRQLVVKQDIPTEALREMLGLTLSACEFLLQTLDRLHDALDVAIEVGNRSRT
jgi:hypothetical protein